MILKYYTENPKLLLERIMGDYRNRYKQIYSKAIRYIITQKIRLIAYNQRKTKTSALILIRGEGAEPKITYMSIAFENGLLEIEYFCSCEDYYYSVHKSKIRNFCSHALASFICLMETLYPKLETIKTGRLYKCNLKHPQTDWKAELESAIEMVLS